MKTGTEHNRRCIKSMPRGVFISFSDLLNFLVKFAVKNLGSHDKLALIFFSLKSIPNTKKRKIKLYQIRY